MDDENLLFEVSDPRGYKVSLSEAQFSNHIINESGHNEYAPNELKECITSPEVIYQSSTHENRDVYFSRTCNTYPNLYIKATIEIDDKKDKAAHVVTAYLSKHIKGGIAEGGLKYVKPKL